MQEPQVALVTGAAGNIGRAVVCALVADGLRVVAADHPAAAAGLDDTQSAATAVAADAAVHTVTFDVCDEGSVADAFAEVEERHGVVTVLVNNAGYQGEFRNVLDYEIADLRRVLDVNLTGAFVVLRAAARRLRRSERPGSIVNVASMAAHGAPNMPAYSASKAGLVGLTRAAAKDLAPFGIRVNSVSPGFIGPGVMWDQQVAAQAAVASPYYADDPAEVARQMIGQVPLGRHGSLDEVASVVAFLASDASSYLTGSDLEIAGGAG